MPILPDIRCTGVILAAGRGRRMGCTKQLVEWPTSTGPKPLVAAAYDAIHPICNDIVVVLGHEPEAVAAALGDRPFRRAESDPDAPMFESIRAGIAVVIEEVEPFASVILQPGDHPEVSPATLHALKRHSVDQLATITDVRGLPTSEQRRPLRTAIIPEFRGRGGHPVLIPPDVARMILEADCRKGLGQFWSEHPEFCHRLPVDDPTILRDIDTPGDLIV
jgi:molybdenum cofactor cytidylyltransferase